MKRKHRAINPVGVFDIYHDEIVEMNRDYTSFVVSGESGGSKRFRYNADRRSYSKMSSELGDNSSKRPLLPESLRGDSQGTDVCLVQCELYRGSESHFSQHEVPVSKSGSSQAKLHSEDVESEIHAESNRRPHLDEDKIDIIKIIDDMRYNHEFNNFIRDIKKDKFNVFSYVQLHAYKRYHHLMEIEKQKSSIAINGTGSICTKIVYDNGCTSGHIFLYAIIINFSQCTLSVYQLLTDDQITILIELWLKNWIRMGAPKPDKVTCDCFRALINALVLAFNEQNIKKYIETLFLNIISNPSSKMCPPISTYLRLDVAYFIKMIANWHDEVLSMNPEEAEQKFKEISNDESSSSIKNWINRNREAAGEIDQKGTEVNGFYNKSFIDDFFKTIALEFPLRSAACLPGKQDPATTSYIEA
ncbi:uncharacterized protein [Chelonus insularis]|uniref:uncharacterized protein n=1 Tax=Chelonus insularis TaxID=460826 RepID=UPI0015883301|nr:uncharacterized protein LOC118065973 [Chelonus insularis]